jgi:hypothetical protein
VTAWRLETVAKDVTMKKSVSSNPGLEVGVIDIA